MSEPFTAKKTPALLRRGTGSGGLARPIGLSSHASSSGMPSSLGLPLRRSRSGSPVVDIDEDEEIRGREVGGPKRSREKEKEEDSDDEDRMTGVTSHGRDEDEDDDLLGSLDSYDVSKRRKKGRRSDEDEEPGWDFGHEDEEEEEGEDDDDETGFGGFGLDDDDLRSSGSRSDEEEEEEHDDEDAPVASSSAPLARAASFDYGPRRPSRKVKLPPVKDETWLGGRKPTKGATMTVAMARKAAAKGVTIEPKPNRGMVLKAPGTGLAEQPPKLDFRGFRARQVLHHHSEVLKWHLERTVNPEATAEAKEAFDRATARAAKASASGGTAKTPKKKLPATAPTKYYAPVEVQSQYVARGDDLRLAVSANEPASQKFLEAMSQEDILQMYEDAAAVTGTGKEAERIRSAARKVLEITTQNARRWAKHKEAKRGPVAPRAVETKPDLARAEALARMALAGRYAVVLNEGGDRHAEQNLKEDYLKERAAAELRGIDTSGDVRDVAGTYIRCGACSTQLGPDELYTHIHDQTTGAQQPHLTGTFYGHEMEPAKFESVVGEYAMAPPGGRGRTMTLGGAERARSVSPPPPHVRRAPPRSSTTTTTTTTSTSGALPVGPPPTAHRSIASTNATSARSPASTAGGQTSLLSFLAPKKTGPPIDDDDF